MLAIAAMAVVVNGLKMLASTKGIYLGSWPHWRWLAGTRKCPQSGNIGNKKPITKNTPQVTYTATLESMVGPGQ